MIKGIIIALCLLVAGDLALNEGRLTHGAYLKFTGFASASSHAVGDSVFRR